MSTKYGKLKDNNGNYIYPRTNWSLIDNKPTIPTKTSDLTNDSNFITNSTAQIAESQVTDLTTHLSAKQATLISGTNIKTINNNDLLGSGNITISGEPSAYVKSASASGNTLTLTNKDNTTTTFTPTFTNTWSLSTTTGSETVSDGTNTVNVATRNTTQSFTGNKSFSGTVNTYSTLNSYNNGLHIIKTTGSSTTSNTNLVAGGTSGVASTNTLTLPTTTGTIPVTTISGGLTFVQLTQAEYDALSTKDANTFYIIIG